MALVRGRFPERFAHETANRPVFHRLRLRLVGPALLERLPLNQFIAGADYRLISLQYLGSEVDRRPSLKGEHERVARPRIDFELIAASVKPRRPDVDIISEFGDRDSFDLRTAELEQVCR